jgi:putative endopeptidase
MTPQTVNAYYHPTLNEIVFPAAILNPPFFDPTADDAVNLGSFGSVVGHEMTHGFDDKGRKFDWKGEMRDWWTEKDSNEYEKRASAMIAQADTVEVHGVKLNGKLTQGEIIADLGGLKLAYRALIKTLPENPPLINGFTPQQRIFLAWSQCWRQNIKEERAKQLVTLDPHGPNHFRANGPLTNLVEFYDAFGITENDNMYRKDRVCIW